ncbi:PsbP-related protein [Methanobacterium petrolearium]|uniref:PsbP-related protein n=1 Tax=Methanobacterium petrolearium TaxID=710190 RepID=UPI001AEACA5A|nr:hypothetical protein [Methanobacterium petrolearium]MBP1944952.1 hypothetical protein [Methanobacterium petrolearium]BDZ70270.1 hypothetical protein GCM10025861_07870 [Methanobacterium petrolearium]
MKKLIYILAILSLVVMASGCTSSDQWASNKTYSGNGITFQYPGTWSVNETEAVSTPSGSSAIAAVGNDDEGFAIGSIAATGLDTETVQQAMNQMVEEYQSQGYGTAKTITVEGVDASMVTSEDADSSGLYTTVAFWVKDDKMYYAVYASKTTGTETMEKILSTLKTT